ncbi:LOW QUALITY PROTEIN: putative ripening-related protein 4 [Durio zibethinus]|uniref:LOW QUALITY PROTEIN: putative ripening-related protein 4 n=1 Tax=Durio zibethinus TaxID=66656 RepID=A0A6P6AXM2_DURZI|nr:LOW QUALITY PROTEIN: putative ripening-related protein 4 [Durio zibethinus]
MPASLLFYVEPKSKFPPQTNRLVGAIISFFILKKISSEPTFSGTHFPVTQSRAKLDLIKSNSNFLIVVKLSPSDPAILSVHVQTTEQVMKFFVTRQNALSTSFNCFIHQILLKANATWKNDSDCCVEGEVYITYKCSPRVTRHTKAVLTLNSFEKGADGCGPSECDKRFHFDDLKIVALSTGWFNKKKRCFHNITIWGNGRSVAAIVVDECDSTMGCDDKHDYQPPCANNVFDAFKAVWKAL